MVVSDALQALAPASTTRGVDMTAADSVEQFVNVAGRFEQWLRDRYLSEEAADCEALIGQITAIATSSVFETGSARPEDGLAILSVADQIVELAAGRANLSDQRDLEAARATMRRALGGGGGIGWLLAIGVALLDLGGR